MAQTAQMPDFFGAETQVHAAVDALDAATRMVSALLADPLTAHLLKTKRDGDVLASRARLGNVVYELTDGQQV